MSSRAKSRDLLRVIPRFGKPPIILLRLLTCSPGCVDCLLMLRRVRSDCRNLFLRPREVNTAVSVEVIVFDVIHIVRHGMRRSDINAPVREFDIHRSGRPGIAAERFQKFCRIVRGHRLIVCVRAQGNNVPLPADPGTDISYGNIRILPGYGFNLVIPVRVLRSRTAGLC